MSSSEPYKWVKIKDGAGFIGIISLEVTGKNQEEQSEIIEDYQPGDYPVPDNWKEGIRKGLAFALSKVTSKWRVTIKNFEGAYVGTNSTIAGCTAMFAFWGKVGFRPDEKLVNDLERFVSTSLFKIDDCIPDFKNFGYSHPF